MNIYIHIGEGSYEQIDGAYNPKDYANLQVPLEVKELFQYIERYRPQEVELNTQLRCFVPEYIPAIGEMDSFVKVSTTTTTMYMYIPPSLSNPYWVQLITD